MSLNRLLLLISLLISTSVFSAEGNKQVFIQQKQWSKYSKGYDFTEKIKEIKFNKKDPPNSPASYRSPSTSFSMGSSWLKYILWGLVIAFLLVLIIVLIINIFRGANEKVVNKSFKTLNIEDIEEANLEHFLDQSLTEGSFKEAIRIRYLMLIRTLSRLTLVTWKKDKTNGTYVNEMFGKQGFDLFRDVTISFERVWYGEKEIGEREYHTIIPMFDQLNKIVAPGE